MGLRRVSQPCQWWFATCLLLRMRSPAHTASVSSHTDLVGAV